MHLAEVDEIVVIESSWGTSKCKAVTSTHANHSISFDAEILPPSPSKASVGKGFAAQRTDLD